jgi:hypothetical protein
MAEPYTSEELRHVRHIIETETLMPPSLPRRLLATLDAERARALVQPTMAAIRSHLHDESIPYKTVLDVLAANEAATLDAERARENDDG